MSRSQEQRGIEHPSTSSGPGGMEKESWQLTAGNGQQDDAGGRHGNTEGKAGILE